MSLNDASVTKVLRENGCEYFTFEPTSTRTVVRIRTAGNRNDLLSAIQKSLKKLKLQTERRDKSHYSRTTGHVFCDNYYFIAKPLTGATEHLKLNASKMAATGKVETWDLFGNKDVLCHTFTSAHGLHNSILDSLYVNENISPEITKTFENYFESKNPRKFKWTDGVLLTEKNELGKYMGELLIGSLALSGQLSELPKAKKFLVPQSSCFSGIDCAILTFQNKLIPISNKFGDGAKASFFSNVLPKVVENRKRVRETWALRPILDALDEVDGDIRRARELVYHYGVRHVLGIDESVIKDPYSVYVDIVAGKKATHGIRTVVSGIKYQTNRQSIIEKLNPENGFSSVTGYFTRMMALDMNYCTRSMNMMTDLLAAKNFYQANLNINKWLKGEIEYSVVPSNGVDLCFYGDKTPLTDIAGTNGLVNYILKVVK